MLEALGINWRSEKGGKVAVFGTMEGLGFPRVPMAETSHFVDIKGQPYETKEEEEARTPETRVMGKLIAAPPLSSSVSTLSEDVLITESFVVPEEQQPRRFCSQCNNLLPERLKDRKQHFQLCMDRPFGSPKRRRTCAPTHLADPAGNDPGYDEAAFERAVKRRRKDYGAEIAQVPERMLDGLVLTLSGSFINPIAHEVDEILSHHRHALTGEMMFHVRWKGTAANDGILESDEPVTSFVDIAPDGTWESTTKQWEDYMAANNIAIEEL